MPPHGTKSRIEPKPAPYLEYPVYLARAGQFDVELITAATMDTIPGRGLGVGVSIGNQPPQVVNVFTPQTTDNNGTFFDTFLGRNHFNNAANNARIMRFTVKVDQPGKYPLRITMVDPTVVVQKVIVHDAPLPKSYFRPARSLT